MSSLLLLSILFLLLIVAAYVLILSPNVKGKDDIHLYIRTASTYKEVIDQLKEKQALRLTSTFTFLGERMNYPAKVLAGHYVIKPGMNNLAMIRLLRGGHQTPVQVTFQSVRTKAELAGRISKTLEIDSSDLLSALNDKAYLAEHGLNAETSISLFIPNTYEMYWNTSREKFMNRMFKEYDKFWNASRKSKAESLGLSRVEVSTLASIVQAEQQAHPDERPVIAGLYLNRLKKGMKLESDPTLVFAIGDFSIRRVLNVHKLIDSPYNTYMHEGLPPGPILLPDISSIDAVLNRQQNDYIFMCAKEDFSNYHNFASDYATHQKNAALFRMALDKKGIFR